MKTLDQIAQEMSQLAYREKSEVIKQKVMAMAAFIEKATVEVKKVSVSKKAPRWGTPSSLSHKGLWGYPQVFVTTGIKPLAIRHKFALVPFQVEYDYKPDGAYVHRTDMRHPAVPELFIRDSPWQAHTSQLGTDDLGIWIAENCPALFELDKLVQAEWDKQVEAFPKEADRYLAKFSGQQRINFQNKLAKEFGKHRGDLMNVPPSLIYEVFRFTRDHQTAISSLVNFCAKNRADALFIDESDVEAALKLAEIADVHKQ